MIENRRRRRRAWVRGVIWPVVVGFCWTSLVCFLLPMIWGVLFNLSIGMGWISWSDDEERIVGLYGHLFEWMSVFVFWLMHGPLVLLYWFFGFEAGGKNPLVLCAGVWMAVICVFEWAWMGVRGWRGARRGGLRSMRNQSERQG